MKNSNSFAFRFVKAVLLITEIPFVSLALRECFRVKTIEHPMSLAPLFSIFLIAAAYCFIERIEKKITKNNEE